MHRCPCSVRHREGGVCVPTSLAWSFLHRRPTVGLVHLSGALPPGLLERLEIAGHEEPQPPFRPGSWGTGLGAGVCITTFFSSWSRFWGQD